MQYTINIANNLTHLYPGLNREEKVHSTSPLTINEMAVRLGISPLLVVRAVVDGKIHPLDNPIKNDTDITLFGPIAGG